MTLKQVTQLFLLIKMMFVHIFIAFIIIQTHLTDVLLS